MTTEYEDDPGAPGPDEYTAEEKHSRDRAFRQIARGIFLACAACAVYGVYRLVSAAIAPGS